MTTTKHVRLADLRTRPPFNALWDPHSSMLARILGSMMERGYDANFPLMVWDGAVIDGHLRYDAAGAAGLEWVWVVERVFRSDDEAALAAIDLKVGERPLSPGELLDAVAVFERFAGFDGGRGSHRYRDEGLMILDGKSVQHKTSAITGARLKVPYATVERVRAINRDPAMRQAVKEDGMTISMARKKALTNKRAALGPAARERMPGPKPKLEIVRKAPALPLDWYDTLRIWTRLDRIGSSFADHFTLEQRIDIYRTLLLAENPVIQDIIIKMVQNERMGEDAI